MSYVPRPPCLHRELDVSARSFSRGLRGVRAEPPHRPAGECETVPDPVERLEYTEHEAAEGEDESRGKPFEPEQIPDKMQRVRALVRLGYGTPHYETEALTENILGGRQ